MNLCVLLSCEFVWSLCPLLCLSSVLCPSSFHRLLSVPPVRSGGRLLCGSCTFPFTRCVQSSLLCMCPLFAGMCCILFAAALFTVRIGESARGAEATPRLPLASAPALFVEAVRDCVVTSHVPSRASRRALFRPPPLSFPPVCLFSLFGSTSPSQTKQRHTRSPSHQPESTV